jgi:XTP/dITP diphosphohydrolase
MIKQIVFATANKNKIQEIQQLIPDSIRLLSLSDIGLTEDIPETQPTIEGNASQKALYVYEKYHKNCFADDTGLEIEALNNKPGVLSARYAGEDKNPEENMKKVLEELKGVNNRNARFKTVISLLIDGKELQFEGIVNGIILNDKKGTSGFGYDPIFAPNNTSVGINTEQKTFAEMDLTEKNKISHRALAVNKLVDYLNQLA